MLYITLVEIVKTENLNLNHFNKEKEGRTVNQRDRKHAKCNYMDEFIESVLYKSRGNKRK